MKKQMIVRLTIIALVISAALIGLEIAHAMQILGHVM